MSSKNQNIGLWVDDFKRQSMIRRALIITGNTSDLSFSETYNIKPVNTIISETLRAQGFRHVVFYSTLGNITGVTLKEWQEIEALGIEDEYSEAEEYQIDDFSTAQPAEDVNHNPNSKNEDDGQAPVTPDQFFATVNNVIDKSKTPVAFVVDWTNYMFGQANALSEQERNWLVRIGQTLRDASMPITEEELASPQSIIIFICRDKNGLPPTLYMNNPLFSEISVAMPNRTEREYALSEWRGIFQVAEDLLPDSREFNELIDITDSMTIRDIHNMARLSRQQETPLTISNLASLYRYGKQNSPWEQLNHAKLRDAKEILGRRVKGQEQAIEAVNRVLMRAYTGLSGLQHSSKAKTPKGSLFFVGPTGVGKTELAKSLSQFLFGDEDSFIRFDMSEFNHEHADQRLVGAPPGYVGYEAGGQLTNAVKERPFSLILFDEIEKAHPRILDKFLQILEDGRLTDGKGETVFFSDAFIVFTSNIGAADIAVGPPEQVAIQFKEAVENHFKNKLQRPELLGRIGSSNIIPFNFIMDDQILVQIAQAKLKPLKAFLREKWHIKDLVFIDEQKSLLEIARLVNRQHGGRGVLNALNTYIFDPLAQHIFENAYDEHAFFDKTIYIDNRGKIFDFYTDDGDL